MIMQMAILRVGVSGMVGIRGLLGITGTEDRQLSIGLRGYCQQEAWLALPSGRSAHWVKLKNPKAAAMTREAEEDWGR
jgi:hypothetical protein